MDCEQPVRQRQIVGRLDRTATDEGQPVAKTLDHPPAGAAETRIDAEDANRKLRHELVIPLQRQERNSNGWSYALNSSCAGLTRASIHFERFLRRRWIAG